MAGSSLRIQMGMFSVVVFVVRTFIVAAESGLKFLDFFYMSILRKILMRDGF